MTEEQLKELGDDLVNELDNNVSLEQCKSKLFEIIKSTDFVITHEELTLTALVSAAESVYYDIYFNTLDYDLSYITRAAKSYAYKLITSYDRQQLIVSFNEFESFEELIERSLYKIKNNLSAYFNDEDDIENYENLIDFIRFAVYRFFEDLSKVIGLKIREYKIEDEALNYLTNELYGDAFDIELDDADE